MPFSFYGTLLSQRMPEAWREFMHLALIQWFTSLSMSHPFATLTPNIKKCPSEVPPAQQD
jgi:hypothetical protein